MVENVDPESAIIEKIKEELETLLSTSDDVADDIHRALWTVHRRRFGMQTGKNDTICSYLSMQ
jgi:hypothetical protein